MDKSNKFTLCFTVNAEYLQYELDSSRKEYVNKLDYKTNEAILRMCFIIAQYE